MSSAARRAEFFALEATEYVGELAGATAATDHPDAERLVRGARRLVVSGAEPALVAAAGGVAWRAQERIAPFVDLAAVRAAGGDPLALCSANARQQIRRSERFYAGLGALRLEAAEDVAQAVVFLDRPGDLNVERLGRFAAVSPAGAQSFIQQQRRSYAFNEKLEAYILQLPANEWRIAAYDVAPELKVYYVSRNPQPPDAE